MMVASVSEDTHLMVWNIERVEQSEIEAMATKDVKDKLLGGVAFTGGQDIRADCQDIRITAFDAEALFCLDLERV
jgi:hypothetical protein